MSTITAPNNELLILDTGLFHDRDTLSAALQSLNIADSQWRKLVPDNMNDEDWDEILDLVLSAKRVISL